MPLACKVDLQASPEHHILQQMVCLMCAVQGLGLMGQGLGLGLQVQALHCSLLDLGTAVVRRAQRPLIVHTK